MRILGLDVGDVRIGVAVSDPLGFTAQGVSTINRRNLAYDLDELKKIIQEYEIEKIVLGLPKNMNGTLGDRAEKVKDFAAKISEVFDQPIEYWDERLSTVAAERVLINGDVSRSKRKKVIDKMAAVLILQGYLDFKR